MLTEQNKKNEEQPISMPIEEDDETPTKDDINEAFEELYTEKQEEKPHISHKFRTFYDKYTEMERQYPSAVVCYRLGDFYEILGDNAKVISNELNLTLTGRDCGLKGRVPMVGFPYHCAENYFTKIVENHSIAIIDCDNTPILREKKGTSVKTEPTKHWIDENTYADDDGIIYTVKQADQIPEFLIKLFGNNILSR